MTHEIGAIVVDNQVIGMSGKIEVADVDVYQMTTNKPVVLEEGDNFQIMGLSELHDCQIIEMVGKREFKFKYIQEQ